MPVFTVSVTKIFEVDMRNTHLALAHAPPPGAGKNLSRHRATPVAVFNRSAAGTAPVRIRASNLSVPNARQRDARLRRDRRFTARCAWRVGSQPSREGTGDE